jgi:hypothetical protein
VFIPPDGLPSLQRLHYYDRDQAGQTIKLTSLSVFATLDGIDKGSIPSKSSENFAERISRVCLILPFYSGRLTYLSTVS